MPLVNIIDNRTRPFRFKTINAVIEAAWHDHSVRDTDSEFDPMGPGPSYEELEHVSLTQAIAKANEFSTDVTLFIYDQDGGIYPETTTEKH